MLKTLQARLQQYMNHELPDVQDGIRKDRGTTDQIANICWIIKKAREFQKTLDCVDDWKVFKEMGTPDHFTASWEMCMQVKKQQLQPDMEQWTGSKSGKEYVKAGHNTLVI